MRGGAWHDAARADRDGSSLAAVGQRGCDKPLDEPWMRFRRIAAPEDDEIGPVAKLFEGGRHFAGPRDRGPRGLGRFRQTGIDRGAERFSEIAGGRDGLERGVGQPGHEHAPCGREQHCRTRRGRLAAEQLVVLRGLGRLCTRPLVVGESREDRLAAMATRLLDTIGSDQDVVAEQRADGACAPLGINPTGIRRLLLHDFGSTQMLR